MRPTMLLHEEPLSWPAYMERNDGDVRATAHVTCTPPEQAELSPCRIDACGSRLHRMMPRHMHDHAALIWRSYTATHLNHIIGRY